MVILQPVQVESIELGEIKTNLIIRETFAVTATISPENAEDKTLTWKSSDDGIVTVDQAGNITAVGGGTATVAVSSVDNVNSSFEIVDGTITLMYINHNCKRDDDNNIGSEWTYDLEINGNAVINSMGVSAGDTITFSAKITENDDIPDVGTGLASYTIT